jgi:hypothetical protein
MSIKIICFLIALRILVDTAHANEDQLNNEYYSRSDCIKQEVSDTSAEFQECRRTKTESNCVLTVKEMDERIIVSCGEDDKNFQPY